MSNRIRVGILISGRGSNLQALIDACSVAEYPAEIAVVVSNVADVAGLERAERAGIPAHAVAHGTYASRESFEEAVDALLGAAEVRLVCLAGFMRVLSDAFVEKWRGRLVNIHPSLLPAFKGLNVHRRVLQSGARISGCSVHFVVPELDSGPIIAQAAVPVLPGDTEDALAARTLASEHKLYPLALRLLAEGRVVLDGERAVYRQVQNAAGELFSPGL
ncbi:MAG TPA: phosphoribosylglycinamide formyltransferase [Rhizomicrobium sp.]|jgi:phosphoribosylglycinamide formyltransferase-1|nr:phosphoribosylglycinamide formyltransferase [Rhizomicrobium sp.]